MRKNHPQPPQKKLTYTYSKSHYPKEIRDLLAWRVIGVQKGIAARWVLTPDHPFLDADDPFKTAMTAAKSGNLIMAQKRIAPYHFELWSKFPQKFLRKEFCHAK